MAGTKHYQKERSEKATGCAGSPAEKIPRPSRLQLPASRAARTGARRGHSALDEAYPDAECGAARLGGSGLGGNDSFGAMYRCARGTWSCLSCSGNLPPGGDGQRRESKRWIKTTGFSTGEIHSGHFRLGKIIADFGGRSTFVKLITMGSGTQEANVVLGQSPRGRGCRYGTSFASRGGWSWRKLTRRKSRATADAGCRATDGSALVMAIVTGARCQFDGTRSAANATGNAVQVEARRGVREAERGERS